MAEAIFLPSGEEGLFQATELARGPWDPGAQHGGAPAALLMRALETLPGEPDLLLSRVTYELLRAVPIGPVRVESEVRRAGRRTQLLEASLSAADGTELVRARAVRVRRAEAPSTELQATPGSPGDGAPNDIIAPYQPMFAPDAVEVRFASGAFSSPGPAMAWFRLRVPVVAGEEPTPLQRLAAAADFGNGISSPLRWDRYLYINPDLTIYIERVPTGKWFALESVTRVHEDGVGLSESALFDERGRLGHAIQALLVAPRPSS